MNLINQTINDCFSMTKVERIVRVCELSVKQELGIITPVEIIELTTIQMIRELTGELDQIRQQREED